MGLFDRIAGRTAEESSDAEVIPINPGGASYMDRGLTASAEKIDIKKKSNIEALKDRPYREWQQDAWMYYDAIAEIKYAFTLLGAVMSRIRIFPALILDPDAPPQSTTIIRRRDAGQTDKERETDKRDELKPPSDVTDEVMRYMERLVKDLGSGAGGIPGMQRAFALNIAIAGECYLCQIDGRWSVRSTEEVQVRAADDMPILRTTRSGINRTSGSTRDRPLPKGTYIGRIWRAHPQYSGEPDSSMLGLLEMCDELLTLQRMIRSVARSKMNAGLVLIDDAVTVSSSSVAETPEDQEQEADPFEQEFMLALSTPVGDESSMSTVVPMIGRVSGGEGGVQNKVHYVKFEREADRHLVERADRALERIMQGIDIPKDIITGLANVKYSNAVQIDEGLYKSHVEPMELLLVDSLTTIYLRPAMKKKFPDLSDETLSQLVIWYDPTEVVTKPDPAHAAEKLYDNFEISGDAFRRAFGFADTDAPDENEVANRLAVGLGAAMPQELAAALIKHLLPSVFKEQRDAAIEESGMPESARRLLDGDQTEDDSTSFAEAPEPDEPSNEPVSPGPIAPYVEEQM